MRVREVIFTVYAVCQFRGLPKEIQPFLKDAIRLHLVDAAPSEVTRNKSRLRRPSEHADYELRAGNWQIFYRVEPDRVIITLLGEKVGSRLIVEGEEIKL